MKKILIAAAILVSSYCYAADPSVSEKALKNFATSFPKAQKVSWYLNTDSYEVAFMDNDVRCRMWYTEDGEILRVMRYYNSTKLSPFILGKIHEDFAGKKVFGVTEVTTQAGVVYKVILEDENNWYHVTSDAAGNTSLDKKFVKA